MKTIYRIAVLLFLTAVVSLAAFGQDAATSPDPSPAPVPGLSDKSIQAPRTLGSQTFQIDLGLMIPLFSSNSDGTVVARGNIGLGGVGHLRYGAFLNQYLALGIDLSGAINAGPNAVTTGNTVGFFNVGPHVSGFFRLGNFEIPVSLMPAFSILSYGGSSYLGFSIKPSVGLYYDITPNWSIGLNVDYWWVPELYSGVSSPPVSQNRFGNLLEVSISALYSF